MSDEQPAVLTMLSTAADGLCGPDGSCHLPIVDRADDTHTPQPLTPNDQ